MTIITTTLLSAILDKNKRNAQEILPELIKRLILANAKQIASIRIPDKDDIWAPGFDGVIDINDNITHVNEGVSVWEFGTNSDALKKINEDYEKRTKNSLGIEKDKTSFYLVVPKVWAFKEEGFTEWERKRAQDWKSVHVIDAVELCQWINETPSVTCWLLEKYGDSAQLEYGSIEEYWSIFSKKTNPNLVGDIFLSDREEDLSTLLKIINKTEQGLIRVKSETFVDAYGFCLAALRQNVLYNNTALVINNFSTFKLLDKIVKQKILIFNFRCDKDVITQNENKIIMCFNQEDISIKEDILLKRLNKKTFENALIRMGVNERDASRYCKITNRNIQALIRNIQGLSNISQPAWIKDADYGFFVPLLFIRNINSSKESNRVLVEYFSNKKYENFEDNANFIIKKEEAPIKQVEMFYSLINYEELWDVLQLKTSDSHYRKLVNLILGCVKLEDAKSMNVDMLSQIEKGTFFNLISNLIYFSQISEFDRDIVSKDVKNIILEMDKQKKYNMLYDSLSTLAKAAPESVLEYINSNIAQQGSKMLTLFEANGYGGDYCKILWALDILARQESTKVKACFILKELYLKNYIYKISNSPKDSIINTLCLWNTKGALLIEEKKNIILKFLDDEPKRLFGLIVSILKTNSFSFSYSVEDKEVESIEIITYDTYFAIIDEIIKKLYKIIFNFNSTELLLELLKEYDIINPKILEDFAKEDYSTFEKEQLQEVYFYLANEIYHIRKYHADENDKVRRYIPFLSAIANKIKSEDLLERYIPFFKNYWECPIIDEVPYEDKDDYGSFPFEYRVKLYGFLKDKYGDNVYVSLLDILADDIIWGKLIHDCHSTIIKKDFLEQCLKRNKLKILAGFMESVSVEDFEELVLLLREDEQMNIYQLINRLDIIHLLNTEVKKQAFWKHKMMRNYSKEMYKSLLQYNPLGLLNYYVLNKLNMENLREVLEVLKNILNKIEDVSKKVDEYHIDDLFTQIDNLVYDDSIAELELKYFNHKVLRKYKEGMKKYYFYNPRKIVEKINEGSLGEFYFHITYEYKLPDEAYIDYRKFLFFFETIMAEAKDKEIAASICGNIFGKSIVGKDGIFPHEFVRNILESYSNEKLRSSFLMGKYNSQGVRTIGDGEDELAIANKYEESAKSIEISYPTTASLLRKIAQDHRYTAKSDRIYYEIGFDD